MKLIKRTYVLTVFWILPIIVAGSIFSFYMIKYIIYEETDEFLTYEMQRLINYHAENQALPDYHKVADILDETRYEVPVFRDTLMLEPGDNEMVPHRELYFTIDHRGKPVTIVLRHLLPGKDDIIQGTILIVSGLILLVSLVLFLMVNHISGRIWKPFYRTLDTLTSYKISDPIPGFSNTSIDEFNTLNKTAGALLKQITSDYKRIKEFNENASHELQTHLAMIRANAEKLLNDVDRSALEADKLQMIYNATVKLSQVQRSLLLLSRIGNREYRNNVELDMAEKVRQALELFSEPITLRGITIETALEPVRLNMDEGLAEILVTNIVKNAVKHNVDKGYISIFLTKEQLIIENAGSAYSGSPENLMERFTTGDSGNIGIGLAIVKQICEVHAYRLSYRIKNSSIHIISIGF